MRFVNDPHVRGTYSRAYVRRFLQGRRQLGHRKVSVANGSPLHGVPTDHERAVAA